MSLKSKIARKIAANVLENSSEFPAKVAPEQNAGDSTLPGRIMESPLGPFRVIADRPTGEHAIWLRGGYLGKPVTELANMLTQETAHGLTKDKALFFDIEATGLSHGAGTIAFLIGLAWFEGEELVVEQLLSESPEMEKACLGRFLERLKMRSHFVSFNGKSYDLSVLQNRLVMHDFVSREESLKIKPHLDLLHLCRQLWKGVFPDHRLKTIEQEVLGVERLDDIAGALVPQYYFSFLNTGKGSYLHGIIEHNRQDLLSLVLLTEKTLLRLAPDRTPTTERETANIARIKLRAGFPAEAQRDLDRVFFSFSDPESILLAAHCLDMAYFRQGMNSKRIAVWDYAVEKTEDEEAVERLAMVTRRFGKTAGAGSSG